MIQVGGNLLRRTRGYPKIIENLLPKLDLLVTVDWRMSTTARYAESNPEDFLEEVFALNTNLGGVSWPEIKKKGYARFTSLGLGLLQTGNATDIEPSQTITANTWHTEKKLP